MGVRRPRKGRRKERGRVPLAAVCVVECAQVSSPAAAGSDSSTASGPPSTGSAGGSAPAGHAYQVGYREDGQEYTLYLIAPKDLDRQDWIRAIRAGGERRSALERRWSGAEAAL
ncbi:hypothetical protein ONE63_006360 [Megalurothrips usitatus]|uniref:PH domain-containing protein n=1 Tax=Megalurothrips usitatus TaxID=439358 RepID=A0AAV7Y016_9NEOP|nr:hypothetical protein ONE63_006360 [Megalurothrips usitatus]